MTSPALLPPVKRIAARLAELPQVVAVALSGSLAGEVADAHSDYDLYIYAEGEVPVAERARIAQELADPGQPIEINNPYWGPEDAWIERETGVKADLVYWSPGWIADQLDRVLVRCEASVGYSTCFWHTIRHSLPVYDRDGWFGRLSQRAQQPYPETLRRAIVVKNHPVLRGALPSYANQIALAARRHDRVSVNHRVAALLASYFDILFAVNRVPHPGEKRLVRRAEQLCPRLPEQMAQQVDDVLVGAGAPWEHDALRPSLDALLDGLDALLLAEGLIAPPGAVR